MALAGLNVRSDLPMIYTSGLVRMDLVKEIKKKIGKFFLSLSYSRLLLFNDCFIV